MSDNNYAANKNQEKIVVMATHGRQVTCENQLGAVRGSESILWIADLGYLLFYLLRESAAVARQQVKKLIAIAVACGKCPKLLLKADKLRLRSRTGLGFGYAAHILVFLYPAIE